MERRKVTKLRIPTRLFEHFMVVVVVAAVGLRLSRRENEEIGWGLKGIYVVEGDGDGFGEGAEVRI